MNPLVSCLTATYGRASVLSEAIECFIRQDWDAKELIILNNADIELQISIPQVRIINEPGHETLGDCRNRLLAEASGEFVRTWDDDDLYLPWAIRQGVMHLVNTSFVAFKPKWSWGKNGDRYSLDENVFEASWTARTDVVRRYGYKSLSGGDEHSPLSAGLEAEGFLVEPVRPSYVYRYGSGLYRISGSLGSIDIVSRTGQWKRANSDFGDGCLITPKLKADYELEITNEEKNFPNRWIN